MSRSLRCLNSVARSFAAKNATDRKLAIPRTGPCRRLMHAALKAKPEEILEVDYSRSSRSPRPVYVDDADEPQPSSSSRLRQNTSPSSRQKQVFLETERISQAPQTSETAATRDPHPVFAEHLNGLFPGLDFPKELARRILTHGSHPAAIYGHNAGLSFMGRRVLESYLLLFLSSSTRLKPTDDLERIIARTVNAYVLGEHIGSSWGLGRAMRWTPAVKPSTVFDAGEQSSLLKSVGLYKVQGDAVAAVVGGVFRQFGGSVAQRLFYTRVLPQIVMSAGEAGLPKKFHQEAIEACRRMGGIDVSLLSSSN